MKIKRVTAKRSNKSENGHIDSYGDIRGLTDLICSLNDFISRNHTEIATEMAKDNYDAVQFYERIIKSIDFCDNLKASFAALCVEADLIRFNKR